MPSKTNDAELSAYIRTLRKVRANVWDVMYSIGANQQSRQEHASIKEALDKTCDVLTSAIAQITSLRTSKRGGQEHAD